MSCYLIGYDLNKKGKDYAGLIDAIKSLGAWWHHLDSTWLVVHSGPASVIRDVLGQHIDADDELLVVGLVRDGAWKGFKGSGSKWLNDNL